MQTPVELFDEMLKTDQQGRVRFHPIPSDIAEPFEAQREIFRLRMNALRKQFLPNRSIDVHLDFIDKGTCNAFACVHNSMGFIGLNRGLILQPRDLFFRMFSHPEFLIDIGDRPQERRTAQHNDGVPDNYDDLIELRRNAGRPIHAAPPTSGPRLRMARVCMDLVYRYLAAHDHAGSIPARIAADLS